MGHITLSSLEKNRLCDSTLRQHYLTTGWLRGTVAERWSLTDELSLSHARPAADE